MTSYVPPVKNGASGWIGYVSLAPRTPTGAWQSNPTLASGDVKISIDGAALANLGTLPAVTPASSKLVKITLSQAETNGDNIAIIFSDAAGAEWCDLTINLQTVARQIDDLAYPATSGRSLAVDASGQVNVAALANNSVTAAALAADAGTEIGTAVWATAARTLTALDEDNTTLDLDATIRSAVGLASANLDTQLDGLPTAAENATAVWGAGARTLTAIDEDNTTLDLDATIRGAIGLAAANLDTQLAALPTAAENADAVWDEDATGHQTQGTFGQAIGDPAADTNTIYGAVVTGAAGATVAADIIAVKADTAATLVDTNELQTDWVNGGRLDTILDARASQTSVDDLPTNAELATALGTADDAVLSAVAALDTKIDTIDNFLDTEMAAVLAAVDTEVAAIKAKTDNLPSDPADASVIAGRFDTLDTSIADLPTNAELATALGGADDAVLTVVNGIKEQTDRLAFSQSGYVDANVRKVNNVTVGGTGATGSEWGPA